MERCVLCGGKLANGRCTECGLDNRKNDKKYRLNIHNEKMTVFHRGDCEDHVNKDYRKKTVKPNQENLRKAAAQPQDQNKAEAGVNMNTRTQPAAGTKNKPQKNEKMTAQRKKQLKERRQTGTVKKKSTLLRLVKILVILTVFIWILGAVASFVQDELLDYFVTDDWNDAVRVEEPEESQEKTKPALVTWDESDDGYLDMDLMPGVYSAGYDLPAGDYQLYCEDGAAWIYWWNEEDEYSTRVTLFSLEQQALYAEGDDGTDGCYELSEVISLQDGGVIYLEDCTSSLHLKGIGIGETSQREPQGLTEEIILQDQMTAGEDFPAGVYDIVLEGNDFWTDYPSAFLDVEDKENDVSYYVSIDRDKPRFYRFPFTEGYEIEASLYGDKTKVKLVPSY